MKQTLQACENELSDVRPTHSKVLTFLLYFIVFLLY